MAHGNGSSGLYSSLVGCGERVATLSNGEGARIRTTSFDLESCSDLRSASAAAMTYHRTHRVVAVTRIGERICSRCPRSCCGMAIEATALPATRLAISVSRRSHHVTGLAEGSTQRHRPQKKIIHQAGRTLWVDLTSASTVMVCDGVWPSKK